MIGAAAGQQGAEPMAMQVLPMRASIPLVRKTTTAASPRPPARAGLLLRSAVGPPCPTHAHVFRAAVGSEMLAKASSGSLMNCFGCAGNAITAGPCCCCCCRRRDAETPRRLDRGNTARWDSIAQSLRLRSKTLRGLAAHSPASWEDACGRSGVASGTVSPAGLVPGLCGEAQRGFGPACQRRRARRTMSRGRSDPGPSRAPAGICCQSR